MPARPSEPILEWLRNTIKTKGVTVAALADASGEKRAVVRRVLAEQEPLTVDQLIQWTKVLELGMEDFAGISSVMQQEPSAPGQPKVMGRAPMRVAGTEAESVEEDDRFTVDPFGMQAEQAIRLAFAMGVDFAFIADSAQLQGTGVPETVLARHPERLLIKLDAAYHRYNEPRYAEDDLTLTLSFDTVRVCRFPWSSLLQVTYFVEPPPPITPEPEEPEPSRGRPTLRLVQ